MQNMATHWLTITIAYAPNMNNGSTASCAKAITKIIVVRAILIFIPWLKLLATNSFLVAPAYRNNQYAKKLCGITNAIMPVITEITYVGQKNTVVINSVRETISWTTIPLKASNLPGVVNFALIPSTHVWKIQYKKREKYTLNPKKFNHKAELLTAF